MVRLNTLIRPSTSFRLRLDPKVIESALNLVILLKITLLIDLRIRGLVLVVAPLGEHVLHVAIPGALHSLEGRVVDMRIGLEEEGCFAVVGLHAEVEICTGCYCVVPLACSGDGSLGLNAEKR